MVSSSSTTRSKHTSYRRQALMWLMMTLLLGVLTALLWMFSQTPAIGAKIENAPIAAPEALSTELTQPLSVEALHELDNDVQPINFEDTIRDLRNYPDEFKDKRYLLANKGKWTVQVMNVAENEVITSYLEGRDDRKKFSYFRYRDDNNQLRYMLTYGLMSSPQEAVGAAKLVDFGLPADVRVLPEEISRYVGIVDNYERPGPIKDLSTRRSRSVRLQPTEREVPARKADEGLASNEAGNGNQMANNGTVESIRQSEDTSATLAVNEERTVITEDEGRVSSTTAKKEDNARSSGSEDKSLPVVPTPKPPTAPDSSEKNSPSSAPANKSASNETVKNPNAGSARNDSAGAAKNKDDSIKELIEEKTD
ncbi:hypothetical protein AAIR29_00160 [Psychrobacter sp. FBL11]|uniref:Uncharacterized protein n=1 Tax=Psychrobacter saeujeotis TaxID=3143436 RepID=A0ABU9X3S1_9GAMM|nr:hypothetical protein [uncultured Psychrobacter sp.]